MPPTRNRNKLTCRSTATGRFDPIHEHDPAAAFEDAFQLEGDLPPGVVFDARIDDVHQEHHDSNDDNSFIILHPAPNVNAPVGQRLAEIRENFTPEAIRRSTKSKKTFAKHQQLTRIDCDTP